MKGQAISRSQPSKLNSACVNYTWMMRRLKNAIAIPYSYQQLSLVTWSDMAALLMKAWPSLHRILQIGKSIDNKGKWLNNYINLSYFSWITSFIVFMMDFTYADMKFRSHFNDDEEAEYVSQSFTRFRIKGTSNKYFFGNLIIRTFPKSINFSCSD